MIVNIRELLLGLIAIAGIPVVWRSSGLSSIYPSITLWIDFLGGLAALLLPVIRLKCPKESMMPEAPDPEDQRG